ncbi:unnamed protein product [Brassica napus]|nr:unnamed protein product [Brassica napus]
MVISDNGDDTTLITFESNEESQEDNNKQVNHPRKRVQRDKWLIFPTKTIQEMMILDEVLESPRNKQRMFQAICVV